MRAMFLSLGLLLSFNAFANINSIIDDFYYKKAKGEMTGAGKSLLHSDPYCEPRRPATRECIEYVCEKLGSFSCDDRNEIARVARACSGGTTVSCMNNLCNRVGGIDCKRQILNFATSCKYRADASCINQACELVGRSDCDDPNEVTQIASACAGGPGVGECLSYTCGRLSSFECDDLNEVVNILRSCR